MTKYDFRKEAFEKLAEVLSWEFNLWHPETCTVDAESFTIRYREDKKSVSLKMAAMSPNSAKVYFCLSDKSLWPIASYRHTIVIRRPLPRVSMKGRRLKTRSLAHLDYGAGRLFCVAIEALNGEFRCLRKKKRYVPLVDLILILRSIQLARTSSLKTIEKRLRSISHYAPKHEPFIETIKSNDFWASAFSHVRELTSHRGLSPDPIGYSLYYELALLLGFDKQEAKRNIRTLMKSLELINQIL